MSRKKSRLVALAIDAPNNDLLESWIENNHLPNMRRLFLEGRHRRLVHRKHYRNETCWTTFGTAAVNERTGFHFSPSSYEFEYDSIETPAAKAFYSLGDERTICTFDLPLPFAAEVNGIQVVGWASELSASVAKSEPPDVMGEIRSQFGDDPKLEGIAPVFDVRTGSSYRSFPLPSMYDTPALLRLSTRLVKSALTRGSICNWLLHKQSWDLFLGCFPETHTANHLLWHLGHEHPSSSVDFERGRSPLLDVTQAVDAAIGRIRAQLSPEQTLAVFTIDHTAHNVMDVPSMALLPELLFRWCFDGAAALGSCDESAPLEPPSRKFKAHWKHETWALATELGRRELISPATLDANGDKLSWNPASWYRLCWPRMRAFALPGVSDGYIRLNVKGRESKGLVDPEAFGATLDSLVRLMESVKNPRTGNPLVKKVIRIRERPDECPEIGRASCRERVCMLV